jgi:hypothetical protein
MVQIEHATEEGLAIVGLGRYTIVLKSGRLKE